MITEYEEQLREIYISYSDFHAKLMVLESEANNLATRQSSLHQELENTRNTEKSLINKIEESLGKKLTQDDLLQIIDPNGKR